MTTLPAVPPQALRMPALTRSEAQARSALAQRVREQPFPWGEQTWQLTLAPLPEAGPLEATPDQWLVRLAWGGAPVDLLVPGEAARAWIAASFPDLPVPALPSGYLAPFLEAACAPLLETVTHWQRGAVEVQSLAQGPAQGAALAHVFAVRLDCAGHAMQARMATDSLGLMLMAGMAAHLPPARNDLPAGDVPVLLRAEIGCTRLRLHELASLAVGDAVMLEQAYLTPEGALWLGAGTWGMRVQCEGHTMTVMEPFTSGGMTMMDDEKNERSQRARGGLDQLPMRLAFDLGERLMTLGELQSMQVGQSFELGRPLSSAVSLRVNGALVATGELVEIDGRLGVTISTLGADAPTADGEQELLPAAAAPGAGPGAFATHDDDDDDDDDYADDAHDLDAIDGLNRPDPA